MNKDRYVIQLIFTLLLGVVGAACRQAAPLQPAQTETPTVLIEPSEAPSPTASQTPIPTMVDTPAPTLDIDTSADCSAIEHLPPDSAEAQQIIDEFVANYKEQYPTEYMGMALLDGVYRLIEWAVVIGSITGEGTDVIAVHRTSEGYQIAEMIHVFSLESPEEMKTWVIQPLLEKLPEAPTVLFICMDQS